VQSKFLSSLKPLTLGVETSTEGFLLSKAENISNILSTENIPLLDNDNIILLVVAFFSGDLNEFERKESLPLPKDLHGLEYGSMYEFNFSEGAVIENPKPTSPVIVVPSSCKEDTLYIGP
jgi:hypothetical protein